MREFTHAVVWAACLALAGLAPLRADEITVSGRVVDASGKPVAGAEVDSFWHVDEKGKQKGYEPAMTDADGRFTLAVNFHGEENALMAIDADRKTGGIVLLSPKSARRPVEIRASPLVHVHGTITCRELGTKLKWTNVYTSVVPGDLRLIQDSDRPGEFSALLPPGSYSLNLYGGDVIGILKALTVAADRPDVDLGAIDLKASVIAKHKGKAPPAWHVADARGIKKGTTPADLAGKWVLVDFWGHWCGPCVQGMAELIDFYEDHAAHRDRFEILAFHDGSVKSLADLDKALVETKAGAWSGREIPFPVLLDSNDGPFEAGRGKTIEGYGISSFPSTILIDPQGKLVTQSDALEFLEKQLPEVPLAERLPRSLDRQVGAYLEGEETLGDALERIGKAAKLKISTDPEALKAAGITPANAVSLKIAGTVSLRSWLELILDGFGLVAAPGGTGIVVTRRPDAARDRAPSKPQVGCKARIENVLARPVDYDFQGGTLSAVAAHFEEETGENVVLDPAARRVGAIDPTAKVSGSGKGVPLRDAFARLLTPLGLGLEVRQEVIVVVKARP